MIELLAFLPVAVLNFRTAQILYQTNFQRDSSPATEYCQQDSFLQQINLAFIIYSQLNDYKKENANYLSQLYEYQDIFCGKEELQNVAG